MGQELRTPLHAILGYAQLLRMEGDLNEVQAHRLDAILTAGTHLLEQIASLQSLSDSETNGSPRLTTDTLDSAAAPMPARALKVLVVDDMEVNRDIASSFLRSAGHLVTLAESGSKAVSANIAVDFDVVLMDLRMPDMDGLEATRRIRAMDGARAHVPIVALSAMAFIEQVQDCREAGMNGHLAKPFTSHALVQAIHRAADARPSPAALTPDLNALGWARADDRSIGHFNPVEATPYFRSPETRDHSDPTWIEIVSPWNRPAKFAQSAKFRAAGLRSPDEAFVLQLRLISCTRGSRLVDSHLSCVPPVDQWRKELHWLVFVKPSFEKAQFVSADCDLWRWSGSIWKSVTVPGAHFSPEEMYDHGWRYCGPCTEKIANVEIHADTGDSGHLLT